MSRLDADKIVEEWKIIEDFDNYSVSNLGNIKRNRDGKLLKFWRHGKYGHQQVGLYKDGKSKKYLVHVLVARAFVPNPSNKPEVCHIDNSLNTNGFLDNSAHNLVWGTHKENCNFENTRARQSENHADVNGNKNPNFGKHLSQENKDKMMVERGRAVLQWENGIAIALFPSLKEAGRKTGISWTNIRNVCKGEYKTAGGYEWSYACKHQYDVEKMVKILEEKAKNCQNNAKYYGEKAEWMSKAYRDAIEVVKGGTRGTE